MYDSGIRRIVVMPSIEKQMRQELTFALGESQTENPYVAAGIAIEIFKAQLERLMAQEADPTSAINMLLAN